MNGRVGRARVMARITRERIARAVAHGIDPTDKRAVRAFDAAYTAATFQGIRDQSRCRCGGDRHAVITRGFAP